MVNRMVLGVFVCWLILASVVSQSCVDECDQCISWSNYCNVCKNGKYGDKCQLNCDFAEYCKNKLCYATGLKCYDGCVDGRYGDRCDKVCSQSCWDGHCWDRNGECHGCESGKYGRYCENDCPDGCERGCQSDGSCSMHCTDRTNCRSNLCNGATGNCYFACEYGWSGEDCNVPCPPNNCKDNRCDRYIVSKCDSMCLLGWYGEGCDLPCNLTNCASNCDQDTGNCILCKTGFFGDHCEHVCRVENCLDNCDQKYGECSSCTFGKYGNNCEKDCQGCYLDKCQRTSGRCESYNFNGTRIYCKPGFYGEYCLKCLNRNCSACNDGVECTSCIGGLYGKSCDKHCSFNCIHTDGIPECDMATGACLHGCYYGDGCVNSCQDIDEHCIDCSRTRTDSFLCIHCNNGYYTSSEGNTNGRRTCLPCGQCLSGICLNDTGICPEPCSHGYWGDRCDQTCPEGCMICDKLSGACLLTYSQLDDNRPPSESSSMPYTVGSCVGGIGVAALVVTIVIIVKARTMKCKQERAETTYHTNLGQREDVYYSSVDAPFPEIPTQRTSNNETEHTYTNTDI